MTASPVLTITDELLSDLESLAANASIDDGDWVHGFTAGEFRALLSERAELKRDAERWRYARDILTIEAIELAQSEFIQFGLPPSEADSIRADQAIDQAMQERQE